MASVKGTQTERGEESREKQVVLKGTARMVEGDDQLLIVLPIEDEVPVGRLAKGRWKVTIKEKTLPVVTTLSWNSLTQDQWNNMTQDQWNEMIQ